MNKAFLATNLIALCSNSASMRNYKIPNNNEVQHNPRNNKRTKPKK